MYERSYEVDNFNVLWVCDFNARSPKVMINNRPVKAILSAINDDHSRMVVGYSFKISLWHVFCFQLKSKQRFSILSSFFYGRSFDYFATEKPIYGEIYIVTHAGASPIIR